MIPRPFVERRICNSAGAVSPGGGIGFAAPSAKAKSHAKRESIRHPDRDKGDFKAYMSEQQQAGPMNKTSTQLHSTRRPRSEAGSRSESSSMSSLTALPKGLANLKAAPGPSWLLPNERSQELMASCSSQRTNGGLGSGESSLVLQDSWMPNDMLEDSIGL